MLTPEEKLALAARIRLGETIPVAGSNPWWDTCGTNQLLILGTPTGFLEGPDVFRHHGDGTALPPCYRVHEFRVAVLAWLEK